MWLKKHRHQASPSQPVISFSIHSFADMCWWFTWQTLDFLFPSPLALTGSLRGGGCRAATGRIVMNIRLEMTNAPIDKVGESAQVSLCVREAARSVHASGSAFIACHRSTRWSPSMWTLPNTQTHARTATATHGCSAHTQPSHPHPHPPALLRAPDQWEPWLTAIVTMEPTEGLTMSPWKLHLFTTCERREGRRRGDSTPFVLLSALLLRFNGFPPPILSQSQSDDKHSGRLLRWVIGVFIELLIKELVRIITRRDV